MIAVHHLAAYAGPYAGSFVPMLAVTAREGARRGHSTTVWLRAEMRDRAWVPELAETATLRWLPDDDGSPLDVRRVAATLRGALAEEERPAVLHTHFSSFDLAALLVGAGRRRTAVFWHEHGRPPRRFVARARSAVKYRLLARGVDRILCVSSEITEDMLARGAPRRAVLTFRNGIDTDRFVPVAEHTRARARAALGLDPAARVILHFSWDWMRKGGDLVVGAADRLGTSEHVVWVTVPGPPPTEAAVLASRPSIRPMPARGDVWDLYAAADVFLSASRSEGGPYVLLEALACGLPAVATDLPPQRAALAELPGGEIVAPEPAAIAAAVQRLLDLGATERTRHAQLARERIVRNYALTDWARRLVDLYEVSVPAP